MKPFVSGLTYVSSPKGQAFVRIDLVIRYQAKMLKQLTWRYIILNRELALPQAGQRKAARTVFRKLLLAARKRDLHFFPAVIRGSLERTHAMDGITGGRDNSEVRLVADYIAGMTEKELKRVYRTMEGTGEP